MLKASVEVALDTGAAKPRFVVLEELDFSALVAQGRTVGAGYTS